MLSNDGLKVSQQRVILYNQIAWNGLNGFQMAFFTEASSVY